MATQAVPPVPSEISDDVPALTPAIIQRAVQANRAATDPRVHAASEHALREAERVVDGLPVQRITGRWRTALVQTFVACVMRVRIEGREHVPPGAAIIAPNHISHFDPFIVLSALPAAPFCTLVGDDRALFSTWWKRALLRIGGGILPISRRWKEERAVVLAAQGGRTALQPLAAAIERTIPDTESISSLRRLDRIMIGLFARGESIMIFPEGRLGEHEGMLHQPLKRGTVLYALRAGVPIVPVAIIGAHHLFFGKRVTIRFGPPLHFGQNAHAKSRDAQAAIDALTAAMVALLPKTYVEPRGFRLGYTFLKRLFL